MSRPVADRPLAELDSPEFSLALDSQDVAAALESAGRLDLVDFATGVVSRVVDGEVVETWWTDSARPFAVAAVYSRAA